MNGTWDQVSMSAFVAAFVSGIFLLGGYYYNRRIESRRGEESAWQRVGMPVINAADDLIARIFDIMVRNRDLALDRPVERSCTEVFNPPKELSTVWRLMFYLAAATYLEQHVADERSNSKISILRYFANNKSRIALKGNMYGATTRLQTEGQQLVGSKVLSLGVSREIRDVGFFEFVHELRSDDELYESAEAVRRVLNVKATADLSDGQLLSLAHFVIYLIDLVQDLRPLSKWEEFRLYLATVIRAYNQSSTGRTSFLYRHGDLSGEDYLETFGILPSDSPRWFHVFQSAPRRRAKRVAKRAKTGFPREITSAGVKRTKGRQVVTLSWKDKPGDVKKQLEALFT